MTALEQLEQRARERWGPANVGAMITLTFRPGNYEPWIASLAPDLNGFGETVEQACQRVLDVMKERDASAGS